jgi:exopolysaccharide production protein ExoQ
MPIDTFLLALSFYVELFQNVEGLGLLFQLAGIGLAACAVLAAILFRQHRFVLRRFCSFEVCVMLVGAQSLAVSVFSQIDFVGQYSLLFLATVVIVMLVVRVFDLKTIISAAAYAYLWMVGTVLYFEWNSFKASFQRADEIWQYRFAPFSLHPNLTGFIFGGGAMILLAKAYMDRSTYKSRTLYIIASGLSFLIVIAASARASVLALLISLVVIMAPNIKRIGVSVAVVGVLFGIFVSLVNAARIYEYVFSIMDLASETRGLSSGGSGRLEMWQYGLAYIFSSAWITVFGGGLRSSSYEVLGFHTESSYITIMLDSGIISGTILIASMVRSSLRQLKLAYKSDDEERRRLYNGIAAICLFVLIESILNRYLLAIGNPMSLFFLMLCAAIGSVKSDRARERISVQGLQSGSDTAALCHGGRRRGRAQFTRT